MQDSRLAPIHNTPWTVNWNNNDGEKLREFIESETGRKLIEIIRSETFGSTSADFIKGTENAIQKMRQIPYSKIVDFVPQNEEYGQIQETESLGAINRKS